MRTWCDRLAVDLQVEELNVRNIRCMRAVRAKQQKHAYIKSGIASKMKYTKWLQRDLNKPGQ